MAAVRAHKRGGAEENPAPARRIGPAVGGGGFTFGVDVGPVIRPKRGRSVGGRRAVGAELNRPPPQCRAVQPEPQSAWSSWLKLATVSREQTGSRPAGLQSKSTTVVNSRVAGSFWVNFP